MAQPYQAVRKHQRGVSLWGFALIAVLAVSVFAIGGQSLPILMEYQAVKKAANKAAAEGASVREVRDIFDRAVAIDDIRSISGRDLEVTEANGRMVVHYSYEREIPLVGPAYLVYRFNSQNP